MRLSPLRIICGGTLLVVIAGLAFQVGSLALFAFKSAQSGSTTKAIIEIHRGQPPNEIAKLLVATNAVTDLKRFIWFGRLTRQWKKVKVGEYEVSPAMSPIELFSIITSGVSVKHPVTVREGENMYEIAADLESKRLAPKAKFITLCKDRWFMASLGLSDPLGPSLEGFLFPDTYFFNRTMSPEEIIRQMVRRFLASWSAQNDIRARTLGMNRLQVVTLASIIEKETGAQKERPLISSVFHNRLRRRMRLQSDPTTIYGIWETYKGNLHRKDLLGDNAYNTYSIPALPIGPISNPGKEAIEAALNPAQSNYIFFVSHNDGTHEFTATLEDHNRAVRQFQMNPKARQGKSWRDLKKSAATDSQHSPTQSVQKR